MKLLATYKYGYRTEIVFNYDNHGFVFAMQHNDFFRLIHNFKTLEKVGKRIEITSNIQQ